MTRRPDTTPARIGAPTTTEEMTMTAPTQPHILIITETTENGVTDREYSIECPGVTDSCRLWKECQHPECDTDEVIDNDDMGHGVRHQYVADFYGVPTDACAVGDGVGDAAEALNLAPGRYPVVATFDADFGNVEQLTLVGAEVAA